MANENRSERIEIRVTPEEAKMIMAFASQKGVTVTSHLVHSAIPNYDKVINNASK